MNKQEANDRDLDHFIRNMSEEDRTKVFYILSRSTGNLSLIQQQNQIGVISATIRQKQEAITTVMKG